MDENLSIEGQVIVTNSFADTPKVSCPNCEQSFEPEVWLIIDRSERPDLIERVSAGTLHTINCPHCGGTGPGDAPLLIYSPEHSPTLMFSPCQGTSVEQDREQVGDLLAHLRETLGEGWDNTWLQTLAILPRHVLPAALSDNPEEALKELEAQVRQAQAVSPVITALQQLMRADSLETAQGVIEENPVLMEPETDGLLAQLIALAEQHSDLVTQQALIENRALLRRGREIGLPEAIAEKRSENGPAVG